MCIYKLFPPSFQRKAYSNMLLTMKEHNRDCKFRGPMQLIKLKTPKKNVTKKKNF